LPTDSTDAKAKIERLHEQALAEHVRCYKGDQMLGPCKIDALRDEALSLVTLHRTAMKNWKVECDDNRRLRQHAYKHAAENKRLADENLGLSVDCDTLKDEVKRLAAEVRGLRDELNAYNVGSKTP
jgi:hypothetical protein